METIKKLTTQEALAAKDLWTEIFFEDSDVFTDYYFKEKMKDNIGYGLEKDGMLVSMLYRTPYMGQIRVSGAGADGFLDVPLSYIVGVGTKKEYRHRGYMDRLLRRALTDLQEEGQPFTFLMPADPAIYTPYQFRYIYDRPEFLVEGEMAVPMQPEDIPALAAFAQEHFKERYQFFLRRDEAYYLRQQKESRAQNGDVYLWKEQGEIRGFYLYAKEEGKEFIQEAAVSDALLKKGVLRMKEKDKPIIMARITNVPAMLSLMRLKMEAEAEETELLFTVTDSLVAQNNATFHWTVGKKESTIALSEKKGLAKVCIDIADLTEFLFGRKDSRACFVCFREMGEAEQEKLYQKLSEIEVLSRVFLNEIV